MRPSILRMTRLLAGALLVAGCSTRIEPEARTTPADTSAVLARLVPATAADVLARVRGSNAKATLVNVWATWCGPCREEFPGMLDVARAHRADGLRTLLVSADFDDAKPAIARFLAGQSVGDTTFLKVGDDQSFIDSLSAHWSGALPATFVYDRSGRLVTSWEGRADRTRFESAVTRALAAPTSSGGSTP